MIIPTLREAGTSLDGGGVAASKMKSSMTIAAGAVIGQSQPARLTQPTASSRPEAAGEADTTIPAEPTVCRRQPTASSRAEEIDEADATGAGSRPDVAVARTYEAMAEADGEEVVSVGEGRRRSVQDDDGKTRSRRPEGAAGSV